MEVYNITAGYVLNGVTTYLSKYATEADAWNALEIECIRLRRISDNPFKVEQEFEKTCFVELNKAKVLHK